MCIFFLKKKCELKKIPSDQNSKSLTFLQYSSAKYMNCADPGHFICVLGSVNMA